MGESNMLEKILNVFHERGDRSYGEDVTELELSLLSLQLQGGPMSDLEATAFAALPHYHAAVQVRRYDDMGKVPGMKTATLESYRGLIEKFLL